MYVMQGTRPDIAFAVSVVSRFSANPTEKHQVAAAWIFRYLRGAIDLELVFTGNLCPHRWLLGRRLGWRSGHSAIDVWLHFWHRARAHQLVVEALVNCVPVNMWGWICWTDAGHQGGSVVPQLACRSRQYTRAWSAHDDHLRGQLGCDRARQEPTVSRSFEAHRHRTPLCPWESGWRHAWTGICGDE